MTEWRETSLGEVATVQSGFAFKSKDWADDGVRVVKIQNVRHGRVDVSGCSFVSVDVANRASRFWLARGDVLVTMSGEIGSVGVVRSNEPLVLNQRVGRVSLRPGVVADLRYLAYALQDPSLKARMEMIAYGAAQPNISPRLIASLPISLPNLSGQRKVACILSAIDDLIENNRRRVEVLEEIVRATYREWFVHFRYPGHETASLVGSPVGPIPEQWSVESVAELSSAVTRGIAPKYADEGSWVVINQKCIRDERISLAAARRQERAVPKVKRVRFGDVLINSTGVGTLGRVALYRGAAQNLTVDSHVTIARPLDSSLNPWYGLALIARKADFEQLGSGSTGQTELGRADIGALSVVTPSPDMRMRFADLAWPLMSQADELLRWNFALTRIRGLLLPKLISGQLDVSGLGLDALVEDSVA